MALKKTRTMCTTCHARCGVLVYSDEDNRIVKIEGNPDNVKSHGVICGSGMSEREIHNNLEGRLLYPMKRVDWDPKGERNPENRGKSAFERISWDEAMDIIADECLRIKEAYGPEAIITGQGTGRVANHWHCRINSSLGLEGWSLVPTHVCLMPHILPNAFTLGVFSSAAGDMRNAHCAVLWGQNPAMETAWCKEVFKNQAAGITKLIVIDVRFLPNPFYIPELRNLTGLDKQVSDYVLNNEETHKFLAAWENLLNCVMPGYVAEGKQQLAIGVGCTGGQHRSVVLASKTAEILSAQDYNVNVYHRDIALADTNKEVAK